MVPETVIDIQSAYGLFTLNVEERYPGMRLSERQRNNTDRRHCLTQMSRHFHVVRLYRNSLHIFLLFRMLANIR